MDLDELGTFDVVLYAGMLYHMRHPLLALERVAKVTKQRAVIETHAFVMGGMEQLEAMQFVGNGSLRGDPTNWWVATLPALRSMCVAAGFSGTEVHVEPPDDVSRDELRTYTAVLTAFK